MAYEEGAACALAALGFTKQAYGPEDAMKVLQAAKKYVLPKAANRSVRKLQPGGRAYYPISAQALDSNSRKLQTSATALVNNITERAPIFDKDLKSQLTRFEPRDRYSSPHGNMNGYGKRPAIVKGESSSLKYLGTDATKNISLNPDQHKMLQSMTRGHELDELTVDPNLTFRNLGHNSPEVILREHNRLATLPEGYAPVKQVLQDFRKDLETPRLNQFGIDYGNSERLSRHARKRITELMHKDLENRFVANLNNRVGTRKADLIDTLKKLY